MTEMETERGPVGLGGWLILVGIGIVLSPIVIAGLVYQTYVPIFQDGSWEFLTTPGSEGYNPLWKWVLLGEIAANVALFAGYTILVFQFFMKKTIFPNFFIMMSLTTIAIMLADAVVMKQLLPEEPMFDRETGRDFFRSVVYACIWIPYMLASKRVKATFVR